jgi:glycerol-3-phosphate dehydrogenase (NAD(P)+)
MMGLSGLGDLLLTCSSPQSRNFSFGVNLGRGQKPDTIQATTGLAEGAFTASVLVAMARERGVDMPISFAVDALLAEKTSVDAAIDSLLSRPLKAEG